MDGRKNTDQGLILLVRLMQAEKRDFKMAYCKKCGNMILPGDKFCKTCGEPVVVSFASLVADAKEGSSAAQEELYNRTWQEKYYVALKYMKNPQDAEDVLQESYIRAYNHLDSLKDPEKFSSWLSMIVANTAKNELRKQNPMLFSDYVPENMEGADTDPILQIPDMNAAGHPEEAYLQSERRVLLQELLQALTDEQRMAVTMFYVEELPIREIAESLETNENTVKSRLHNARKALQKKAEELKRKGYMFSFAPLPLLVYLMRTDLSAVRSGAGIPASAEAVAAVPEAVKATSAVSGAVSSGSISAPGVMGSAAVPQAVSAGPIGASVSAETVATSGAVGASAVKSAVTGGFLATVGGKIAVIAGAVLLTAGAAFGGVKGVQYLREKKNAAVLSESSAAAENPALSGSSEGQNSGNSGEKDSDGAGAQVQAGSETTEAAAQEETDVASLSEEAVRQRLRAYLEETLIPGYGLFNPLQAYYGVAADGSVVHFSRSWNAESCTVETEESFVGYDPAQVDFSAYDREGIISAAVRDFTGDGRSELLIIYGEKELGWDQPFSAALFELQEDGMTLLSESRLEITDLSDGQVYRPTDIHLVENADGKAGLLLLWEGQHSDVSMRQKACVVLPQEDFYVDEYLNAELEYDGNYAPSVVLVQKTVLNGSGEGSTQKRYPWGMDQGSLDDQGRAGILDSCSFHEIQRMTDDFYSGAWDHTGFLMQYLLTVKDETLTSADIQFERGKLEYTEAARYDGMDADIQIDTIRFLRKDGARSEVLEKINAVLAAYYMDAYQYGLPKDSHVVYYHLVLSDPVYGEKYLSLQGYVEGYVGGGAHGWGAGRSWTFSLETGDPMDLRTFTGLPSADIQQGILQNFRDSGETQKDVYDALGMDFCADVRDWETSEYSDPNRLFRNFYIGSDGWIYLENVCSPPASGGHSFPSRVARTSDVSCFVGNPNYTEVDFWGQVPEQTETAASAVESSEEVTDPWADSGEPVALSDIQAAADSADYMWMDVDVNTGKIRRLGYLGSWDYNGSYTWVYYYHEDGSFTYPYIYVGDSYGGDADLMMYGHTAKELVDQAFSSPGSLFTSGGRLIVVWNSPYGLCAYDHKAADYSAGDPSALKYTLDEQAISRMLSEMNYPESLVPKSDKQE